MPYRTLLILTAFICSQAFAQDEPRIDLDNPRPLIMQDGYKLGDDYSEEKNPAFMQQESQSGSDELTDHCAQLRREYDSLEGKPQRRWALKERYKMECQAYFDLHQ